jgi:uncharacterized protein
MNAGFLVALIFILPGLALVFMPVFPAVLYMFVVSALYAWLTGFVPLTGFELMILGVIAAVSIAVDQLAGILGARLGGASKRAALFGLIGAITGSIFGGPALAFAGIFLGIFVAEISQLRSHIDALRAARAGLIGALAGYVTNIILAFVFVILFLILTLRG